MLLTLLILVPLLWMIREQLSKIFNQLFKPSPSSSLEVTPGGRIIQFNITKSYTQEIDIELIKSSDQTKIEIKLTRISPYFGAQVDLNTGYRYRFRTKDNWPLWSSWSNLVGITTKSSPYSVLQNPSREHCLDLIKQIKERGSSCNMILLGRPGHGKSCFMNTLFTAYNEVWTTTNVAYPSNHHVTSEMKAYALNDKIKIYDTPGWENHYDFGLLKDVLKGRCSNLTIHDMKTGNYTSSERQDPQTPESFDVILLVIAADYIKRDKEVIDKITDEIHKSGLPSVAIITRVDKLTEEGEDEITNKNFFKHPIVINYCQDIKDRALPNVFPILNYTSYTQNDCFTDYYALNILNVALKSSLKKSTIV